MTAVSEHLHACKDCSREHAALKSLIRELGNIRTFKAPDNLLEKIQDRITDYSIFDRIRDLLSFTRIRFPVELAAFATTAILIISFIHFFPAEEKGIIKMPENKDTQLTMDQGTLQAQIPENQRPTEQPVKSPFLDGEKKGQQVPIKLALTLITQKDSAPIPSQSVSFGNSGTVYTNGDPDMWRHEDDPAKEIIQPDEVNSKMDDIIKSVKGKILSRGDNAETGYPSRLTLDIPGINYRRFISKIEALGALQSPAPALPEGSDDAMVLIQMEFTQPQ